MKFVPEHFNAKLFCGTVVYEHQEILDYIAFHT